MTTLVTSANVQVNSFLTQGTQLPIVIVDEATQCTESQCIVPLCVQPALLILVGDSHQLAATIQNPVIERQGYGVSLFERLERIAFPKLSLRIQYRMAPEICKWPNDYVYRGELINSKRVREAEFKALFGSTQIPAYSFIQVENGVCEKEHHSYHNIEEAKVVAALIHQLFSTLPPSQADYSIGVIAPYVAQVHQIRKAVDAMLISFGQEKRFVKISSVELVEAIAEPARDILETIHMVLERTPPELVSDVAQNGIVMAGGGSLIYGFDQLVEKDTGIRTTVVDDALSCAAFGSGKMLMNLNDMPEGMVNLARKRQMKA